MRLTNHSRLCLSGNAEDFTLLQARLLFLYAEKCAQTTSEGLFQWSHGGHMGCGCTHTTHTGTKQSGLAGTNCTVLSE